MAYTLVPTELIVDGAITSAKLDTNLAISGTLGVTGEVTLATHLNMGNNDKIKLGASGLLEIYHDSSNGYISNSTGNLYIGDTNGNVHIQAKLNEDSILAVADGGVTLYHDTNAKLATTSAGVTITGALTSGAITSSGVVTVTDGSTSAPSITNAGDANTGIYFPADDNFGIVAGGSRKLLVNSSGVTINNGVLDADGGITVDNITIDGNAITLSSGDLTLDVANNIFLDADGGVINLKDGGTSYGQLIKSSNDFRIFNPISDGDLVFRGNDSDGGGAFTALTLDMSAAGAATFNAGVTIGTNTRLASASGILFLNGPSATAFEVGAGSEKMRLTSSSFVINDSSEDFDFRVESNNNANMLFVDGGNDRISIGHGSPTAVLDVRRSDASGIVGEFHNNVGFGIDIGTSTADAYISSGYQQNFIFKTNAGSGQVQRFKIDKDGFGDYTSAINDIIRFGGANSGSITFRNDTSNQFIMHTGTSDSFVIGTGGNNDRLTITAAGAATFSSSVLGTIINAGASSSVGIGAATADANVAELGAGYLNLGRDDVADSAQISFSKNGILHSSIVTDNNDLRIKGNNSNLGIRFDGNDGGSAITALRLDMSAAGNATFNKDILLSDNSAARFGTGQDLALFHDGTNSNIRNTTGNLVLDATVNIVLDADGDNVVFSYGGDGEVGRLGNSSQNFIIHSLVSNKDMLFNGIDDGSAFTALTLDMSAAGAATFNSTVTANVARTSSSSAVVLTLKDNVTGAQTNGVYKAIRSESNGTSSVSEIRFIETDGTNNNTAIGFATAASAGAISEKVRIHPSGVASFNNGIELGSGLDATAANTLDDYEVGTWTPVVHGSGAGAYTYSGVTSRYTKIGNLVTLTCQLTNITTSGSGHAGYLQIRNAPFNKIGDTFPVGSVELSSIDMSSGTSFATVQFITSGSTNTLYIRQHGDNSAGADLPVTGINSGTSDITISIQYTA